MGRDPPASGLVAVVGLLKFEIIQITGSTTYNCSPPTSSLGWRSAGALDLLLAGKVRSEFFLGGRDDDGSDIFCYSFHVLDRGIRDRSVSSAGARTHELTPFLALVRFRLLSERFGYNLDFFTSRSRDSECDRKSPVACCLQLGLQRFGGSILVNRGTYLAVSRGWAHGTRV